MIMLAHQSTTCLINKSEFRKLIMARGTAAKSATGASMSKYDVEVEARLKALEDKAHEQCDSGGDTSAVEAKLDALIAALKQVPGTKSYLGSL